MLSNMKFGSRIILALILPILGLVFFSGYLVLEKRQVSQEMEILRKMASLAPTVSAAMHELQKERGASAVYIGSKGQSFKEELPQQHKETDAHMAELEAALNAIDKNVLSPSLLENMQAAHAELGELAAKRERILKRTQNIMQVNGYYVSVISNLLNIVEGMAALSQDAAVSRAIAAYTTFLQAKEHAGQELAVGSAGFGASKFQPILHRRFIELITEQGILLDAFAVYAPPAQKEALDALLSGAEAGEVDRMRTIAVNSQYANIDGQLVNTTEGIRAPDWFGVVSKKIAAMKEIEDALASGLIAQAESVQSEASTTFFVFLAATLAALIVTGGLAYAIVTGITGPILGLTTIMERLAHGDTTIAITGTERGDEIGEMSQAVQVFKENMVRNQQLAAEQQQENEAKERKRVAMEKLAGEFEKNVSSALSEVTNASSDMRQTAQNMAATAEETSRQSTAVAAAAEQASTNVQTVASAAEELSSSISEISRQVSQSTKIAGSAVTEVSGANDKVQGLAEAARKIGEVVALITDIADQTNLLALNATIEAARAGEAGKGFAVVASEVKNLANQTAKATEDISAQIAGIQGATNEAVAAIESIGSTINQINEITSAIAAAVEEQGAATQEIARNVEQAAQGTTDVTSNITLVNRAADDTGNAAKDVLNAISGVTSQSDRVNHEVEDFLKGLKAI